MAKKRKTDYFSDDPLWYKDAIIYEVHVRAFHDSDADGVGDFRGLTEKLDYLQELGITALWLLPFYPSPLKDDGYDIADYQAINPLYGNMRDFDTFLSAAHSRGIRVITELVINHTSDQHAWFQRARRASRGSAERNFYMWTDDPEEYPDARIIFKDFEHSNWAYDPLAGQYYWHRFYSHQPDLNFDSPALRKAVFRVLDFWLDRGVDGMRLDAVPYLYAREGTNCENLPETHSFLKKLRAHVDSKHKNRMLLAEANQWPEDAAAYFGTGDECHMNFHFPLMPRLFMSLYMEDRFPIVDILDQTPPIAENAQWALFLRNHDELTLEMVTDEERDYMYRIYAADARARVNLGIRRRLSPLLDNNRRRIELMNALLFSLPGTPVLYYGDEIGMGDNVYLGDRNGVRTPMQWSADRNAGFSRANPQSLYLPVIIDPQYHYETVNVEAQTQNASSLYWWMKRLIALRKRFAAFGRGTCEFLFPSNRRLLAFVRRYGDEVLLIVANLSRFAQFTQLDLAQFQGKAPVELFGNTEFPVISDAPYFLSLGPHAFFWFAIQEPKHAAPSVGEAPARRSLRASGDWTSIVRVERDKEALEALLPSYMGPRRWFRSKAMTIDSTEIVDAVPVLSKKKCVGYLVLVFVSYTDRDPETYLLPLGFVTDDAAETLVSKFPHAVIAQLSVGKKNGSDSGLLCDAAYLPEFNRALLEVIERQRALSEADSGSIQGTKTNAAVWKKTKSSEVSPRVGSAEQSNTSILFGDRLIMKLYRRVEAGLNPDVELGHHLTAARFEHTAPLAGTLEYKKGKRESMTVASLQGFVKNEGDSWQYTLDELERFFERAGSARAKLAATRVSLAETLRPRSDELPSVARETIGAFLSSVRLLGERTAEMHRALAQGDEPAFAPEAFTPFYRRALYQSLRNSTHHALSAVRERISKLPSDVRADAKWLLDSEKQLLKVFNDALDGKIQAKRIRVHGDYHLGQVLYTGRDFVVIDFEGEPGRSLGERRTKRCALKDVAGMLRSFQYASYTVLHNRIQRGLSAEGEVADMKQWATAWYQWTGRAYLEAYIETVDQSLLGNEEEISRLLRVYLLEKALYELSYEINNRPNWVTIPLIGITHLLKPDEEDG